MAIGALLDARRAGGERSVGRHCADGKQIAFAGEHPRRHSLDELGDLTGDRRAAVLRRRHLRADRHREQLRECRVDGGDVALHDDIAALAVAGGDRLFQPGDRFIGRQDLRRVRRSMSASPC